MPGESRKEKDEPYALDVLSLCDVQQAARDGQLGAAAVSTHIQRPPKSISQDIASNMRSRGARPRLVCKIIVASRVACPRRLSLSRYAHTNDPLILQTFRYCDYLGKYFCARQDGCHFALMPTAATPSRKRSSLPVSCGTGTSHRDRSANSHITC
jgi:hypothetical protein